MDSIIIAFDKGPSKSASNPSIADLTKTFTFSSGRNPGAGLKEVRTEYGDPSRLRRAHRKSKDGCTGCNKRRVKCIGKFPCEACIRRGERCVRRIEQLRKAVPSTLSGVSQAALPHGQTPFPVVELHYLELVHHFQMHTIDTLIFPIDAWQHTLRLSSEFDFLLDAILCLSARHLAFLKPENASYPAIAASHLCRALAGFRRELSQHLTSRHLDVFIATSSLLQFEIWTQTDYFPADNELGTTYDPSRDHIFGFCASLKEVFLRSFPSPSLESSVFMPYVQENPIEELANAAQISKATLSAFQVFFSKQKCVHTETLETPLPYSRGLDLLLPEDWLQQVYFPTTTGIAPVVTWLCLLLSYLPESEPRVRINADSHLMMKLARYIFSFPIMARGHFASLVQQKDDHALVLLYHFYRAARVLLPKDKYWWAHKRAAEMERTLRNNSVTKEEDIEDSSDIGPGRHHRTRDLLF
ncbi:hypothetical protein K491DRAFT_704081 [Lophiostoma macrostomum CBS 122681]|uniref:Zn(2)-C6 fungal-type domain-containing protein n=1 Tax=Lophiostoma macrostomum CBS 122681 TaxID=1314788 RepID=A0A6A6T946_9PLEO|nr:hypothetical protein K491DRAFT_704081 [Lophiostoma macrostomum CBS 122681]